DMGRELPFALWQICPPLGEPAQTRAISLRKTWREDRLFRPVRGIPAGFRGVARGREQISLAAIFVLQCRGGHHLGAYIRNRRLPLRRLASSRQRTAWNHRAFRGRLRRDRLYVYRSPRGKKDGGKTRRARCRSPHTLMTSRGMSLPRLLRGSRGHKGLLTKPIAYRC